MLVITGLFCAVAGAAEKNFHVVLGSFTTEAAAEKARGGDFSGRELIVLPVPLEAGEVTWRLVAGPFKSYADALEEKEILGTDGVDSPWITSTDVLPVPVRRGCPRTH